MISLVSILILLQANYIIGQNRGCYNDNLTLHTSEGIKCMCPEGFIPNSDFDSCIGCNEPPNFPGYVLMIYGNITKYGYPLGTVASYNPPKGFKAMLESLAKGIMCILTSETPSWSTFIKYPYEELLCDPMLVPFPVIARTYDDWKSGSNFSFSCPPDYMLVGNEKSTCNEVGVFVPDSPRCEPIICSSKVVKELSKSFIVQGNEPYLVGNFFSISCIPIQTSASNITIVEGEMIYRCGSDGNFYPQINAVCKEVSDECVEHETCLNGGRCINIVHRTISLTTQERAINSENICDCERGYHGWNCGVKNYCPQLLFIPNGNVVQKPISYLGDVALFSCASDFHLTGNSTLFCNLYGTWSSETPICVPIIQCSDPPKINDGDLISYGNINGQTAIYKCHLKCSIVGNPVITCIEGIWSTIPNCSCEVCTFPPSTSTLFSTNSIDSSNYACNNGLKIINSEHMQCFNRSLFGINPSCVDTCEVPFPVDNSIILSITSLYERGVVTFKCNPGFRLVGINKVCSNGKWIGDVICMSNNCGQPNEEFLVITPILDIYVSGSKIKVSPANKTVNYSNYHTNEIIDLECVEGFWTPPVPILMPPFTCIMPNTWRPLKAVMNTLNSYIEWSCDEGYAFVGTKISICRNGAYDIVNTDSACVALQPVLTCNNNQILRCPDFDSDKSERCVCEEITCKYPPLPKFGGYFGSNTLDSKIEYVCYGNRILIGHSSRTCEKNGEFNGNNPTCSDKTKCTSTGLSIPNGAFTIIEIGPDQIADYKCDCGFILKKAKYRYCLANFTWSLPIPSCVTINSALTNQPSLVGPPGVIGNIGSSGRTGPKGIKGIKGENGFNGQKGEPGAIGNIGYDGTVGETGPKGNKGFQGRTGRRGIKGASGDQGIFGGSGSKGYAGTNGRAGLKGLKGLKGSPTASLIIPIDDSVCVINKCPPNSFCMRQGQLYSSNGSLHNFSEKCFCLPGINDPSCETLKFDYLSTSSNRVCMIRKSLNTKISCIPGFTDLPNQTAFKNMIFSWRLQLSNKTVITDFTNNLKYTLLENGRFMSIINPSEIEDGASLTCKSYLGTFTVTTIHALSLTSLTLTPCNQTCGYGYRFPATLTLQGSYCSIEYEKPIKCGNRLACSKCTYCLEEDCQTKAVENCPTSSESCIKIKYGDKLIKTGCDSSSLCPNSSSPVSISTSTDKSISVSCCKGSMCNDF